MFKIIVLKIGIDAKRAFTNYSGLGNYSRDVIPTMLSENMNAIEAHLLIRIQRNDDALFSSLKVSSSIDYCVSLYEALRTFMFTSSNSR